MTGPHLAIDASTYSGSAALLGDDGTVVAQTAAAMRGMHEERLMPAIAAMLKGAGVSPEQLCSIICGAGPGSFTSLRIAASIAKGFAHGLHLPLRSISSLLLIPGAAHGTLAPGRYLALLDAMRGDHYALRCERRSDASLTMWGEMMLLSSAEIAGAWSERESGLRHIGPGSPIDVQPHARGAGPFLLQLLSHSAEDAASWEPNYGRLAEAEVRLRLANAALQRG